MAFMLPLGFRFKPRDDELILGYLLPKVLGYDLPCKVVIDSDVYKVEPWHLPKNDATIDGGITDQYYFTLIKKKSEKGSKNADRTLTKPLEGGGSWKAVTGDTKIIYYGHEVGLKKQLVFKTSCNRHWIMHEFRLPSYENGKGNKLQEWVVCRVRDKDRGCKHGDRIQHTRVIGANQPSTSVPVVDNFNVAERYSIKRARWDGVTCNQSTPVANVDDYIVEERNPKRARQDCVAIASEEQSFSMPHISESTELEIGTDMVSSNSLMLEENSEVEDQSLATFANELENLIDCETEHTTMPEEYHHEQEQQRDVFEHSQEKYHEQLQDGFEALPEDTYLNLHHDEQPQNVCEGLEEEHQEPPEVAIEDLEAWAAGVQLRDALPTTDAELGLLFDDDEAANFLF